MEQHECHRQLCVKKSLGGKENKGSGWRTGGLETTVGAGNGPVIVI